MFKELLSEIRAGVISRMFILQPRRAAGANSEEQRTLPTAIAAAAPVEDVNEQKKKRKRH
jgi:hypothetical protein